MVNVLIIIFPILWLTALALAYFLSSKKHPINFKLLVLYVALMAMLGPTGEIFVGTLYEAVTGNPLWQYKIFPTHDAYTSLSHP